jgi:hypothetical protein
MASPYLHSGEIIVLTTSRVSVDAVSYDVMLTNERIFFIDNLKARLEPRIIPLSTILSVQGGKTPAQDPVITLMFRPKDEGDTPRPLNLIFSQNPNENRRPERDDWVRGLIQLSINQQEKGREAAIPEVSPVSRETGLRPMARHGVAPEMVRPLSNVIDTSRTPAPVTVIPEYVAGSGEIPVRPEPSVPVREEHPAAGDAPGESPAFITPVRRAPLPATAPPARVIIPQIIEELLPEKKPPAPDVRIDPAPAVVIDEEALFRTIPASIRSMTITEVRPSVPDQDAEMVPVPETEPPVPVVTEEKELPEIIRALYTGSTEPVEPEGTGSPDPGPESVYESPEPEEAGSPAEEPEPVFESPEPVSPEPEETVAPPFEPEPVPETAEPFTPEPEAGIHHLPEPATGKPEEEIWSRIRLQGASGFPGTRVQDPAAAEASPVRHPLPPAREIRPFSTSLTYLAILLIIIALAAAGAILIFTQAPVPPDIPATPAPTPIQVTTESPRTTVQTPTVPPVSDSTVTPELSRPPVSVPQEGVWVRISSTAEYYGTLGNTGMMRTVSGTGDDLYPIFRSNQPVLVSVQKMDNSGTMLTATVYRNGTPITTRSITSPMGTVEILINPETALAPGFSSAEGIVTPAATQAILENY